MNFVNTKSTQNQILMKKNILNIIKKLGLFTVLFFIIAIVFVWIYDETEIGELQIINGQGTFTHEAITLKTNGATASNGTLHILENAKSQVDAVLEAAYASPNFKIAGTPELFEGQMTVVFPLDESLAKQYAIKDLQQKLYVVTEELALTKDGQEVKSPTLHPVTIDEAAQTVTATIDFGEADALGGIYEPQRPKFSFFKNAFAQNSAVNKSSNVVVSTQYFPDLEQIKSPHFTLNYINKNMPVQRLTDLISEMEKMLPTVKNIGLNYNDLNLPIQVYLKDMPTGATVKYGEMSMSVLSRRKADLNLNKKLLLQSNFSPDDFEEMRVTAGHEFFHIIQQNYWRRQFTIWSAESFVWCDEAMAVAFETLIVKDADFTPTVMSSNKNRLVNNPLVNYNQFDSNFDNRQYFGYGLSYVMQYLIKIHPRHRHIIGDFYNAIASLNADNPETAFNQILNGVNGAKSFWLDFIHTEMTNQNKIHGHTMIDINQNMFLGKGKGSGKDAHIIFDKWATVKRPHILKKTDKNTIVFETNLPNLSAEMVLVQLDKNDATIKTLMQGLGRKYTISVSGDSDVGAMIYHVPYGQKGTTKKQVTNFPNNFVAVNQSVELTDFIKTYIVLVNPNADIQQPKNQRITVTVTFQGGEDFADVDVPPTHDKIDEKALKELQNWLQFCQKQSEPQQQSNQMLMNYYQNKAKEIETAIQLLNNGTNVYQQLSISVKPDDPKTLIRSLEKSLQSIENKQDYAFKAKVKLAETLDNPTIEVQADRPSYELSIDFFDYRQIAYTELLNYLKAVKDSGTIADKPKHQNKENENFYLGNWHFYNTYGDNRGTITLEKNAISVNLTIDGYAIKMNQVPYEVKVRESLYYDKITKIATIHLKTNFRPQQGGVSSYYCSDGNICIDFYDFTIYKIADEGKLNLHYHKKATQNSYSKQSGEVGVLKR